MNKIHFEKFQNAGDIIFVRTPKRIPLNRIAQTVATGKRAKYTHVLLCVMPGLYVHSVVNQGVHLVLAENEEGNFPALYGDGWKVVRNLNLSQNHQSMAMVAYRAAYYIGQKYNGAFAVSGFLSQRFKISRSFCSELIAKIFVDLGHPIANLKPEQILPAHIDSATKDSDQWKDVTSEYEKHLLGKVVTSEFEASLDQVFPIPDMRPMFVQTVNSIVEGALTFYETVQLLNKFQTTTANVANRIPRMSEKEREELAKYMNIDPRSFQSQLNPVVDSIFALDRYFLAREQKPESIEPQHWVQDVTDPLPEPDMDAALAASFKLIATLEQLHYIIIESLRNTSESILFTIATVKNLPSDKGAQFQDLIKQQITGVLQLVQKLFDYDNYEKDLEELNGALKKQLASSSLGTQKVRNLFRKVAQQIQWRQQAVNLRLAERLHKLQSDPNDYDLAYALYADLLTLIPYLGEKRDVTGT